MIVEMLKTTVVCRAEDRPMVLESLRTLGVLHVAQSAASDSQDVTLIKNRLAKIDKALAILGERKPCDCGHDKEQFDKLPPEELVDRVLKVKDRIDDIKQQIDALSNAKARLQPWGDFSFELVDELRGKGIHVYLCACPNSQLDELRSHGTVVVIRADKTNSYAALCSDQELNPKQLPLTPVSGKFGSLSKVESDLHEQVAALGEKNHKLDTLAEGINKLRSFKIVISDELEFATNLNGMADEEELSHITGYVPATLKDDLAKAAKTGGWAALMVKPSHEDKVPTLLQSPKIFEISKPIFDLIGIKPSYTEVDISICFLIFLSIFVGMLLNDAGYGLLLLVAMIVLKFVSKSETARLPINLGMLFAGMSIAWGLCTGGFLGIERHALYPCLQGLEFFTNPATGQSNIMYFCFMLAATHLSIAHIWKAFFKWGHGHKLIAIGQFGWVMFIWGNFFLASFLVAHKDFPTVAAVLYVVGFLVMLLSIEWQDISGVLEFPLSVLSSFVDLLSYIRLFAVGLAGAYVAENFNTMALQTKSIPFIGFVLCVVVIFFGHALNLALGALAILVHGIRLNTLEFSGHIGLSWAGFAYKPFKKTLETDIHNEQIEE